MHRRIFLATALMLTCCFFASAQTITVSAVGEASVKPDRIVLTGQLSESSEKMQDAVTAFADTRRRAMASIKQTEIEGLSVATSSLSIRLAGTPQPNPFGGEQPNAAVPGSLVISQTVTLTVPGVDRLDEPAVIDLIVKLMSAAKEAGIETDQATPRNMMMMQMGMGEPSGASAVFEITDPEQAKRTATRAAIERARADATHLAELAGGKLGKIVSIADAPVATDDEAASNPYALIFGMMMGDDGETYATTELQPITVARPLSVSFELITE